MAQVTQTNRDGDTATFTPRPTTVRRAEPRWLSEAIMLLQGILLTVLMHIAGYTIFTGVFWFAMAAYVGVTFWVICPRRDGTR